MTRWILPLLLLGIALPGQSAIAMDTPRIRTFEVVQPQPSSAEAAPERIAIVAYGRRFDLALEPDLEILRGFEPGARERALAVAEFHRGEIIGVPGSWARVSRVAGHWTGAWFDGTELYLLDTASDLEGLLAREVPADATVVYRFSDLDLRGTCAVDRVNPLHRGKLRAPPRYLDFVRHLAAIGGDAKSAVRQLRVTLVTDTEFSGIHGVVNRDAVVAARMAVVDGIYSNQVGTQIGLRHVEHLSSNGTLDTNIGTGSDGLLNRFRLFMTSGAGSGIPKGGLNHLLTGKDIAFAGSPPNFGLAGVAYINVLCSNTFGYGLNEVRANNNTASLIIAHEMGHNFDAPHDGNDGSSDQRCIGQAGAWLMSPSINGSSTFSPCTRAIVETAIGSAPANCFAAPTGGELIFRNGFEP